MLVLGTLSDEYGCSSGSGVNGWDFLQAPSITGAEALLAKDPTIRVGLWAYDPATSEEHYERFPALRAAHPHVQWLAVLPPAVIDDRRTAAHVAHYFFDFLTIPVSSERLWACAGHADGMAQIVACATKHPEALLREEQMVGASEPMQQLFRDIRKIAASGAPVLISGESGTGKELAARAIHERSARAGGPFVALDCGAIPPTLIQSELFGYEKGAFTGAAQRRCGHIEVAQDGTLFIDEIGDLPIELQSSFLRFLQQSTINRVGNPRPIAVNARVIAATHVDLEEAVRQGRFREDLYYRLNVLRIRVPALREREGDVDVLARYFLAQFSTDSGKNVRGYTNPALELLRRHSWPGNIRELINRVRRAVVMCDGVWITPRDLELERPELQAIQSVQLEAAREGAEQQAIREAIKSCGNNYSAAARMLGVSRQTFYRLLDKYREASLSGFVLFSGLQDSITNWFC